MSSPAIEQSLTRLARLDPRYAQCADFLEDEALALDENRFTDWLEMLHTDLDYRVPMRLMRERAAGVALSDGGFHFLEDYESIENRVNRLATDYAWAEDPPARYRRFVTNVRVSSVQGGDDLSVSSNLLLYRERMEHGRPDLLVGRRDDLLRPHGDDLVLVRRHVLLDHTVIAASNLSMFL